MKMKHRDSLMLALLLAGTRVFAAAPAPASPDEQVLNRRFPVTGAPEIVVSLLTGYIRVTAHALPEVALVAKPGYQGGSASARVGRSRSGLRLESEQSGSNTWIGVENEGDPSQRSRRQLGWRSSRRDDEDTGSGGGSARSRAAAYTGHDDFRNDIELRVPRAAHLKLRTVNGGDIEVDGVEGEFDVYNVNGGITLKRSSGYGRAHTANGTVTLELASQPSGEISLKSLNGALRLIAPRGLNALFDVKTVNGKIHSDFPMIADTSASSPAVAGTARARSGMRRIGRAGSGSKMRAGSGNGPSIMLSTLNGEIEILENKN